MSRAHLLAVARGDAEPDLVVAGGRVFSAFTREWLDVDVAVVDGAVAGLGRYDGRETLDASGGYVVPGFIDAHMHLESVKLMVDAILPYGSRILKKQLLRMPSTKRSLCVPSPTTYWRVPSQSCVRKSRSASLPRLRTAFGSVNWC